MQCILFLLWVCCDLRRCYNEGNVKDGVGSVLSELVREIEVAETVEPAARSWHAHKQHPSRVVVSLASCEIPELQCHPYSPRWPWWERFPAAPRATFHRTARRWSCSTDTTWQTSIFS